MKHDPQALIVPCSFLAAAAAAAAPKTRRTRRTRTMIPFDCSKVKLPSFYRWQAWGWSWQVVYRVNQDGIGWIDHSLRLGSVVNRRLPLHSRRQSSCLRLNKTAKSKSVCLCSALA